MALPEPSTPQGAAGLAALLADPRRALVALDFDGTLAPIVEDPESAVAHPAVAGALGRLAARIGTVAVITGRPAAVAVRLGGFADATGLRGLTVLGHYGLERWDAATGKVTSPDIGPGVAAARAELPRLLADAPSGTAVEDKGSAVAVHVRRTERPAEAMALLREPLSDLAARHGLVVEPGRMVLELRPPGIDKGAALRALVEERAAHAVAFAGDDLGDLAAFDAVDALRQQGHPGFTVCSGSAEVTELARRADLVVDGPDGVVAFLDGIAAALTPLT